MSPAIGKKTMAKTIHPEALGPERASATAVFQGTIALDSGDFLIVEVPAQLPSRLGARRNCPSVDRPKRDDAVSSIRGMKVGSEGFGIFKPTRSKNLLR